MDPKLILTPVGRTLIFTRSAPPSNPILQLSEDDDDDDCSVPWDEADITA